MKYTARNTPVLAEIKRHYNVPIYKRCLAAMNDGSGYNGVAQVLRKVTRADLPLPFGLAVYEGNKCGACGQVAVEQYDALCKRCTAFAIAARELSETKVR